MEESYFEALTEDPGSSGSSSSLSSSLCCRLCASSSLENENEDEKVISFVSLFEEAVSLPSGSQDVPLLTLVNKYLPLKIKTKDGGYSRVVCSQCVDCIRATVDFFLRLAEGQKVLKGMLRREKENKPKKDVSESRKRKQNPSPKRLEEEGDSNLELRRKRVSRLPARYASSTNVDLASEDKLQSIKEQTHNATTLTSESTSEIMDVKKIQEDSNLERLERVEEEDLEESPETHAADIEDDKSLKRSRKRKKLKSKPSGIFACSKCPRTFNNNSSLHYHTRSDHEGKTDRIACGVCGKTFAHKQFLLAHKFVHEDEKAFQCDKCPAKFKSRSSLYTHKVTKHEGRRFACEVCGSFFTLKSSLVVHMRSHTGEKPFQCDICEKGFVQSAALKEHRRTHTGERPYECSVCHKFFPTTSQLRSHSFCHSKEAIHLCQVCGKGFNHKENFKYHMRRHRRETPCKCQICGKAFAENGTLEKHMRLHTGEKRYKCDICQRGFTDSSNFRRHKLFHSKKGNVGIDTTKTEGSNCPSPMEAEADPDEGSTTGLLQPSTSDATIMQEQLICDADPDNVKFDVNEDNSIIYLYSDGSMHFVQTEIEIQASDIVLNTEGDDTLMDPSSVVSITVPASLLEIGAEEEIQLQTSLPTCEDTPI